MERVNHMLKDKKVLVLGMARSGYHVAKLLGGFNKVIVTDRNDQKQELVDELKSIGVEFIKSETAVEIYP